MIPSAYLILNTRREKKDGKFPAKIRVVHQRVPYELRTGIDLTEIEFEQILSERAPKALKEAKIKLDGFKAKVDRILKDMDIFTFRKLSDAYYGTVKEATDIYPFFEQYIADLNVEDRLKTATGYQTAMNSFKKYDKKVGFYEITPSWLAGYSRWMKEPEQGNSDTTIGIYTRYMRSIFNYAISLGVIKKDEHYPFGKRKFVIPASRNVKKALTIEQVSKISKYETIPGTPEDKARDFWMISYFCNGINFKDLALLKNKDFADGIVRFVRAKTKNTTKADQSVITCYPGDRGTLLIEKWRVKQRESEKFLFDILNENDDIRMQQEKIDQFIKTTNKYMKRISTDLELENQ